MTSGGDEYQAAMELLTNLTEVFVSEPDTEVVDAIRDLQRMLGTAFQVHQTSAKDMLSDLSKDVDTAEQQAMRADDEAAFRAKMGELEEKRQAVLASIGALSQEKAATLEQVQALRVQVQAVNEAVAQLEHEQAVKLPRVKHSISLYANICGIKWDYDSKDIAGHVMPEGRPVKAFSVPAGSLGETELANHLWGVVAAASGVDLSA